MSDAFDQRAYSTVLGQFASGVTVIATSKPDGTPLAFTANSFTSVSLSPPLLLVCVAKSAARYEVFCKAPYFLISILAEEHNQISRLFATRRPDKFDIVSWRSTSSGVPLIFNALASFECEKKKNFDAGDHVILVGHVKSFGHREGLPLGHFSGRHFTVTRAAATTEQ